MAYNPHGGVVFFSKKHGSNQYVRKFLERKHPFEYHDEQLLRIMESIDILKTLVTCRRIGLQKNLLQIFKGRLNRLTS